MRHFHCTIDGTDRTVAGTSRTTFTLVRIDDILFQGLALAGRTFLVNHVCHILIPEVVDGGQHRVRGSLAETAERRVFDSGWP